MKFPTTATALALVLGLGTAISLTPDVAAAQQQQGQQTQSGPAAGQKQGQMSVSELRQRAEELKGRKVVNQDGTDVGELSDIVVSNARQEPHGIIEVGGVLGVGAKEIAVPFDQLQVGQENITMMSQKSEEELESMQEYDESQYTPIDELGQGGGSMGGSGQGGGTQGGTSGSGSQ